MSDMQTKIRDTAANLLKDGTVGYIIGWGATRFDDRTTPIFIKTPEDTEKLVWNKYCINGLAKYALNDKFPENKIGILVRGCDSRAVNRLIKDNQLERENLYLIGIPCDGKETPVCADCSAKNPVIYDTLLGEPVKEPETSGRFSRVKEFESKSADEKFSFWSSVYDKCIRCYACRNVCPACNCRECYADQAKVGWQGKQLNRAENQIYGVTRAFHVGDRCIECGECERVCPMHLPIALQTKKILSDIEDLTGNYECGLDDKTNFLGEFDLSDRDEFM